jgi:hypothetical protein
MKADIQQKKPSRKNEKSSADALCTKTYIIVVGVGTDKIKVKCGIKNLPRFKYQSCYERHKIYTR